MAASILHRVTGDGMATVGTCLLVWWLAALAGGEAFYAGFVDTFTVSDGSLNVVGYIVGIGLSWVFFQHMASGIRHLVMDTGAGFELKVNKTFAILTFVFSILATIAFWAWLLLGK
jgi:succinate dehydrogenase / fumarate reductase cytochrome b subunit